VRDPCVSRAQVVIQNGVVLAGTLCKKSLGAAAGGLVHIIWMEHGPDAARAFLSQSQYTINQWLLQHGFSIGACTQPLSPHGFPSYPG
jgi:DNA-directed RNA polymerase II subunit RPB1